MNEEFQITISISNETAKVLKESGYKLYGLKAVQSAQTGGRPAVWFQTKNYVLNTIIKWQAKYQAYSSKSEITPGGQITALDSKDILLGQTFQIENEKGEGKVITESGVPPSVIAIKNTTPILFTCGLSGEFASGSNIFCAFPMYGNLTSYITPAEKVLLMFSTLSSGPGTIVEKSPAPGLFIDLTGTNSREVTFDINTGWTWGKEVWARQIPADTDLVPILIDDAPIHKEYRVQITMKNQDTVNALHNGGYYLYVLKAIQNSERDGKPLVWFRTKNYAYETVIFWTDACSAYTSDSEIKNREPVSIEFQTEIYPGQTLDVDQTGKGKAYREGSPSMITINNTSTKQFTCGLCASSGNGPKPYCAFPLYGKSLDTMTPVEKVMLMFSSEEIEEGSVIENFIQTGSVAASVQSGLLIDLTDANQRDVNYDINTSWDWGKAPWAQSVPPNANLVPLLIENSTQSQ